MNGNARAAALGAAAGILLTAGVAGGLVFKAEDHFVTRREYETTLVYIKDQLAMIRATVAEEQRASVGRAGD